MLSTRPTQASVLSIFDYLFLIANRKKEKLKDSPEKNSPTTAKSTPKQEAVTLNKSKEKAPIQPAKSDTPMSEVKAFKLLIFYRI